MIETGSYEFHAAREYLTHLNSATPETLVLQGASFPFRLGAARSHADGVLGTLIVKANQGFLAV